jgi:hypothetical protein
MKKKEKKNFDYPHGDWRKAAAYCSCAECVKVSKNVCIYCGHIYHKDKNNKSIIKHKCLSI